MACVVHHCHEPDRTANEDKPVNIDVKSPAHLLLTLADQLVGSWSGTGTVEFPTMDTFSYRESLTFSWDEERHLLSYRQLAYLLPRDKPSHAESGYLLVGPTDIVQWINIQSAGRCEVLDSMDGLKDLGDEEIGISFQSTVIVNDNRMISSRRKLRFDIDGTYLKYRQDMKTTTHDVLCKHLTAELTRA